MSPFRYGVISDIHANLQALEAVTGALERIGVDRYLCPGDLVGYGAQPNECLEVVAGLEAVCVAGNHDLMAIGELPTDKCIPLGRRAIRWTRDVLSDEARAYLCALPRRAEAEGGIVIAHGALHDPERYILTTDQAGAELDRLAREHPGSRALAVGHTHQAFACDGRRTAGEPATEGELALAGARAWLLNPGAVGQWRATASSTRNRATSSIHRSYRWMSARTGIGQMRRRRETWAHVHDHHPARRPRRARRRRPHRHRRPRRARKMAREHAVELRTVAPPEAFEEELEAGLRLEASGWKGQEGTAILSSPAMASFYRDIARDALERGELRFSTLRLDGRLVAFDLAVLSQRRYFLLKTAYDESVRRLAPGLVLRRAVIERCFELDLLAHEFLGIDMPWKQLFATDTRLHVRWRSYERRPLPIARYAYRGVLRPAVKRAVRR